MNLATLNALNSVSDALRNSTEATDQATKAFGGLNTSMAGIGTGIGRMLRKILPGIFNFAKSGFFSLWDSKTAILLELLKGGFSITLDAYKQFDRNQKLAVQTGISLQYSQDMLSNTMKTAGKSIENLYGSIDDKLLGSLVLFAEGFRGNSVGVTELINKQLVLGEDYIKTAKIFSQLQVMGVFSNQELSYLADNLSELSDEFGITTSRLLEVSKQFIEARGLELSYLGVAGPFTEALQSITAEYGEEAGKLAGSLAKYITELTYNPSTLQTDAILQIADLRRSVGEIETPEQAYALLREAAERISEVGEGRPELIAALRSQLDPIFFQGNMLANIMARTDRGDIVRKVDLGDASLDRIGSIRIRGLLDVFRGVAREFENVAINFSNLVPDSEAAIELGSRIGRSILSVFQLVAKEGFFLQNKEMLKAIEPQAKALGISAEELLRQALSNRDPEDFKKFLDSTFNSANIKENTDSTDKNTEAVDKLRETFELIFEKEDLIGFQSTSDQYAASFA